MLKGIKFEDAFSDGVLRPSDGEPPPTPPTRSREFPYDAELVKKPVQPPKFDPEEFDPG